LTHDDYVYYKMTTTTPIHTFIHQMDTLDMYIQTFQNQLEQCINQIQLSKDKIINDTQIIKNTPIIKTDKTDKIDKDDEFSPPQSVPDILKTSYFEYKHPIHTLSKSLQDFLIKTGNDIKENKSYSYIDILQCVLKYIETHQLMNKETFRIRLTPILASLCQIPSQDIQEYKYEDYSTTFLTFFNIHHYLLIHFPQI
jgi:predicted SPOUT superfamily RNA methylase MTH1